MEGMISYSFHPSPTLMVLLLFVVAFFFFLFVVCVVLACCCCFVCCVCICFILVFMQADEVQLENFFSTHGQVLECKIIMDKVTGKSKGYGFVTFKDAHAAEFVKQTANFNLLGKNVCTCVFYVM